jgi:hypothetical protein
MTNEQRHDLASRRAEEYAPTPVNSALVSGIVGSTAVGMFGAALAGFYSINVSRYWIVFTILVVLGFAIPFGSSAYRRRKHIRATSVELKDIHEQATRFNDRSL